MVLNIAHRGASSLAPENTLSAARKAYVLDADVWETDVTVTADEELVLLHDETLPRTTNAAALYPDRTPWLCSDFTLTEIRTLEAGSWFVNSDPFGQIAAGAVTPGELVSYRFEIVPLLRSMLVFTAGVGWRVNVELKALPPAMSDFPLPRRVIDCIEQLKIPPECVILSSFNHEWLRQARSCNHEIELQALVGEEGEGSPVDWRCPEFLTYNVLDTRITPEHIAALRAKGVAVNVWTVDEPEHMRRFAAAGAAGLITDFPQTLSALRRGILASQAQPAN